jgi:hypothetical protein
MIAMFFISFLFCDAGPIKPDPHSASSAFSLTVTGSLAYLSAKSNRKPFQQSIQCPNVAIAVICLAAGAPIVNNRAW